MNKVRMYDRYGDACRHASAFYSSNTLRHLLHLGLSLPDRAQDARHRPEVGATSFLTNALVTPSIVAVLVCLFLAPYSPSDPFPSAFLTFLFIFSPTPIAPPFSLKLSRNFGVSGVSGDAPDPCYFLAHRQWSLPAPPSYSPLRRE
ncbi:hypothetical protein C8J57DRAFT_1504576 [Mycena rebaudengoi]|nr:hypothetical protein C8J57DRAFT_1504576 [Mycena rebaudengoi]